MILYFVISNTGQVTHWRTAHTQPDTWYTCQAPWDNDQRAAELHIHNLSSLGLELFYIFFIYFAKLYDRFEIYQIRSQTAVGHGGRRGLWRLHVQPLWPTTVRSTSAGPTGGKASRRGPRRLRHIRRAPRRQAQPPCTHGDRVMQNAMRHNGRSLEPRKLC
jgi:hypothetical protein